MVDTVFVVDTVRAVAESWDVIVAQGIIAVLLVLAALSPIGCAFYFLYKFLTKMSE